MCLVLGPGDIMRDETEPQKTLLPLNLYSRGGNRQTRRKQKYRLGTSGGAMMHSMENTGELVRERPGLKGGQEWGFRAWFSDSSLGVIFKQIP